MSVIARAGTENVAGAGALGKRQRMTLAFDAFGLRLAPTAGPAGEWHTELRVPGTIVNGARRVSRSEYIEHPL